MPLQVLHTVPRQLPVLGRSQQRCRCTGLHGLLQLWAQRLQ